MRPSRMTSTRSQMPMTSGSSLEITMHADAAFGASSSMMPVDLRLGADVDAAGRLVEDQHLGLDLQPARQQHLLLVAARQRADA